MNTATPAIQALTRRLIALEAAREPSVGPVGAAVRANERLRVPLAKLMGDGGFASLLSRAMAIAKVEAPSLGTARVRPDGVLEGLDGFGQDAESGAVVMAQLLGLLVTFIGEPLTLRLVGDAWPDAPVSGIDASGEGS